MATKTDTQIPTVPQVPTFDAADFEAATARAKSLNDDFAEITKQIGNINLDAAEKNLATMLDVQRQAAAVMQNDAVTAITEAQIKVVSDIAAAYTKAARDFLK